MKLYEIWNSIPAWKTLQAIKKAPKLAYRLMKYGRKLEEEIAVCNKQRDAIMYECAGVTPPTPPDVLIVNISLKIEGPGGELIDNPQYLEFVQKFTEFMDGDSDLEPVGMTMDELIDALGAETGNCISEDELELLEPFFTA